MVALKAHLLI